MPAWRLRPQAKTRRRQSEVTLTLTPRVVSNDLSTLKHAAVNGMGIAALPAYVCKSELRSGQLTRILPGWLAGESTFTALMPHRLGLLPAVRIFVDYLARHLPECVQP
jgi:DNA-binding transcriptional LysR family regulator